MFLRDVGLREREGPAVAGDSWRNEVGRRYRRWKPWSGLWIADGLWCSTIDAKASARCGLLRLQTKDGGWRAGAFTKAQNQKQGAAGNG